MRTSYFVFATAVLSLATGASFAQDKKELKEAAKTIAAQLRASGEPKDRCSLQANIADGPVIIRTSASSALKAGDKLTSINAMSVAGRKSDEVIAILRSIGPTDTVAVTFERDGRSVSSNIQCSNGRENTEPLILALDFAARGKFDACVEAIVKMRYVDTAAATLRAECAATSKSSEQYRTAGLVAEALEMAISDARFVASQRQETANRLRNMEGMITRSLGAARYQQMVLQAKAWPGGEGLFASSTPDWALFRRNAEVALRGRLIDPESARFQWPSGFLLGWWKPMVSKKVEGYWTCGVVNAKNRMGGYTGSTAFVVVLDSNGYVKYSEIGESKDFDFLTESCNKSAKLLPPAPSELSAQNHNHATGASPSLADEIAKLVQLKNSGELTDDEFQAAKQQLLKSSPN